MKNAFKILIIALFCCTVTSCGSDNNQKNTINPSIDTKPAFKNFIEDFESAEKVIPTREIDLTKTSFGEYFGPGWSVPEENHRWAVGKESDLYFHSTGDSDIDLEIECMPFVFNPSVTQSIKVYLNQQFVSEIQMKPVFRTYNIVLPIQKIQNGINRLKFKYRYAEKPSTHTGSNDTRPLAVDFRGIEFNEKDFQRNEFTIRKVQDKIVQQARTLLNYYYRLPVDCYLEIEIDELSHDSTAIIDIRSSRDDHLRVSLEGEGSKKISLSEFAGEITKFSFSVTPNRSSGQTADDVRMTWSKLSIDRFSERMVDTDLAVAEDRDLQNLRRQLKDLDIIYIVFDAFNASHSSLYGYARNTTPFIDKLAETSIVFDQFFANHPYTLASTGTLLTSRYSYEHGLVHQTNKLDPIIPTLPELLSDNQILSFLITSHGYFAEEWGLSRGFTSVFMDNNIHQALESIYSAAYSQQRKFIYLHLMPPHEPYNPPLKFRIFTKAEYTPIETGPATLDKLESGEIEPTQKRIDYIKAMYDANVLYADHIASNIYEHLKKTDIHQKAVIIITSDHGEAFMEHGYTTHNTTIYDEMIHVPFIMTFPEHVQLAPRRFENMASIIDVTPTVLDIFGVESEIMFQGESLLPLFFGRKDKGYIYAETLLTGQRGIRDEKYKFIATPKGYELYNLVQDPFERKNIFEQEPLVAGYFRQRLKTHEDVKGAGARGKQVDLNELDEATIQKLKELGYIK